MARMRSFCADSLWNSSTVWPDQNIPTLTQCFQDSVLVCVPTVVLFVSLIALRLCNRPRPKPKFKLSFSALYTLKIVCSFGLCTLFAFKLIDSLINNATLASILANVLWLSNSMVCLCLQFLYRRRGHGVSTVLCFYWFLTTLCFIIIIYHLIIDFWPTTVSDVAHIAICVLVIVQLLASFYAEKGIVFSDEKQKPELSVASQLTFNWISSVLKNGYKWNTDDLDKLPYSLEHMDTYKLFHCDKQSNRRDICLSRVILKLYGSSFLIGSFLQAVSLICRYIVGTLLLNSFLQFLADKSAPSWKGMFYIFLSTIVFICASFALTHSINKLFITGLQVKAMLVQNIYRKLLTLNTQQELSVGHIVNMVTIDSDIFMMFSLYAGSIFYTPVVFIVSMFILYTYFQNAIFVGVGLPTLLVPVVYWLKNKSALYQRLVLGFKDFRIAEITETLKGIKIVKVSAWEEAFKARIDNFRNHEYKNLRRFFGFFSLIRSIVVPIPFYMLLITLTAYVKFNQGAIPNYAILFAAFALFFALRAGVSTLPELLTMISQAKISIKRIETFLNLPEITIREHTSKSSSAGAVSASNLTVGYSTSKRQFILNNININVKPGQLIAIVGNVGSGKSTLIRALLGELVPLQGHVTSYGSISYASQTVWTQNQSIRKNILFDKPYQENRYQQIINKCCLLDDLAQLKNGDQTIIGDRGFKLSGGQKQRLGIARAAYKISDIYMFDDPLSALDSQVGLTIFDNIIGPNSILRDKTRILVTNNMSVLSKVDYIYALDNHAIVYSGTFNELIRENTDFSKLLTNNIRNNNTKFQNVVSSDNSCLNETVIDEFENTEIGTISARMIFKFLKFCGFTCLTMSLISFSLTKACEVFGGYWLGQKTSAGFFVKIFTAVVVLSGVSLWSALYFTLFGTIKASNKLHNLMLNSILHAPVTFFDDAPFGRLLNRFGSDVEQLDLRLPNYICRFLDTIFQTLALFIFSSVIMPSFLIVCVATTILYVGSQRFYMRTGRHLKRLESVTKSTVCNFLTETVSGLTTIRAFEVSPKFFGQFEQLLNTHTNCTYRFQLIQSYTMVRLEMIGNVVIIMLMCFVQVQKSTLDVAIGSFLITYAFTVCGVLSIFVKYITDVEAGLVAMERINEYVNIKPEAPWKLSGHSPASTWPDNGAVEFINYTTCYKADLKPALNRINLRINPQEKVGLVGRTGAGKSSLTLALFRILEATQGSIIIDGINISTIGLHDLRGKLTLIPQDPILFTGSLRQNLDPNNEFNDGNLYDAMKRAHLDKFFSSDELNAHIVSGGSNLSVGQRQLVCLARAVLRKNKILIMDEATASVDFETDALIQDTVFRDFADCTIITVAHRIKTIMDYDKVVVMEQGEIVEFGQPRDLLNKPDTRFYNLAVKAGISSPEEEQKRETEHLTFL